MIQDISDLPDSRRNEIDPTRVPYSDEALRANLLRLENAWEEFQSIRDRAAVYLYLTPVFELVAVWEALGQLREIACRALRIRGGNLRLARDPVSALIYCTSDSGKADRRTRSKWSRVLQYAARYKSPSKSLEVFVKKRGGINECAARYAQRLGRHSKKHAKRQGRRTLADDIREQRLSKGGSAWGRSDAFNAGVHHVR
jgi:hypothetical protein